MPKMLMFSIAAASALAGAALVQFAHHREAFAGRAQSAIARARSAVGRAWQLAASRRRGTAAPAASGNSSFDAYRAEAMETLEAEHRAFEAFIARLRSAEDREAFQAFLASRRPALGQITRSGSATNQGE